MAPHYPKYPKPMIVMAKRYMEWSQGGKIFRFERGRPYKAYIDPQTISVFGNPDILVEDENGNELKIYFGSVFDSQFSIFLK